MKLFHSAVLCCLLAAINACAPKMASNANAGTNTTSSMVHNQEVPDKRGNPMLVGKATRARLQQAPYDTWFKANYDAYKVDSATVKEIAPALKKKQLLLFMGTWCGDSKREVPRIYKVLDCCGFPPSQIELITVSNHDSAYKQSPTHEERGRNIVRVPTLLIIENNKETGRIVEVPLVSWERDLLAVLQR